MALTRGEQLILRSLRIIMCVQLAELGRWNSIDDELVQRLVAAIREVKEEIEPRPKYRRPPKRAMPAEGEPQ